MLSLATEWGWANTIEDSITIEKLLGTMIEESDKIASHGLVNSPPLGTLKLTGRSHTGANAIMTNCSIESCLEVAQEIRNLR
uniref:Uncharacterized protein n=1 Tax=Oryza punctata TaxID=4537 RepID=A0A0E0L0W6_ORYPU